MKVTDDIRLTQCGQSCLVEDDLLFTHTQRQFARYLVGSVAIVCLISTLFTVLTFAVDPDRFRYPERPIVFVSACYLGVGLAYVVGFAAGDTASCSGPFIPTGVVKTDRSDNSAPDQQVYSRHSTRNTHLFRLSGSHHTPRLTPPTLAIRVLNSSIEYRSTLPS